ncbi:MAG: hypothetical protein KBE77_00985 [Aliarcobacter sp.]|nr:hypothetical protein [Aliarcobacter sp.]
MHILNNYFLVVETTLLNWIKGKFVFIGFETYIFNDHCDCFSTFEKPGIEGKESLFPNWEEIDELYKTIILIRDQILKETGKRIWGLTFTLYPDGRHEIEYDYKIPEGFNEQGEYIGEECTNEAVSGFFDNIRKIGTDEFELK